MKKHLLWPLLLYAASILPVLAQETPTPEAIRELIRQLGDPRSSARDNAQQKLVEIGLPALEEVRKASESTTDLEIKTRANFILKEIDFKSKMKFSAKFEKNYPDAYLELANLPEPERVNYIRKIRVTVDKSETSVEPSDVVILIKFLASAKTERMAYDTCVYLEKMADEFSAISGEPRPLKECGPALEKSILKTTNDILKASMIDSLGELSGTTSADFIAKFVEGAPAPVKTTAMHSLRTMGSRKHMELLMNQIGDSDLKVRLEAIKAAAEFGDARLNDAMKTGLKNADSLMTSAACLAKLGVRDAVPAIKEALGTVKNPDGIASLLYALGELGGPDSANTVRKHMNVSDTRVKRSALNALRKLAGKDAIKEIKDYAFSEQEDVASMAIFCLGEIGWSDTTEMKNLLANNYDFEPRLSMINAIRKTDNKELSAQIFRAMRDYGGQSYILIANGLFALGELGAKEYASNIKVYLTSPSDMVRRSAVNAYFKVGGPEAIAAIAPLLTDQSPMVRMMVANVLGRSADAKHVPALEKAAKEDAHLMVRGWAAVSLAKLGEIEKGKAAVVSAKRMYSILSANKNDDAPRVAETLKTLGVTDEELKILAETRE